MPVDIQRQPQTELQAVTQFRSQLIQFFDSIGRIEIQASDAFGFMAAAFFYRQRAHLDSLVRLGDSRDVILVARTMFEGSQLLLWASIDKARAEDWQLFQIIENWRRVREALGRGEVIDLKLVQRVDGALRLHCDRFRDAKSEDGYRRHWRHRADSIKRIYESTGDDSGDLYDLYVQLSDWNHWGIQSVSEALYPQDNGPITFAPASLSEAFRANLLGFRSAARVADACFRHCGLLTEAQSLAEIVRCSFDWMSGLNA